MTPRPTNKPMPTADVTARLSKHTFTAHVGARVLEQYGYEDASDLAHSLLDMHMISYDMGIDEAARIVAQHIAQP